jgi:prolyl-tRNA synthetase
VRRDGEGKQPVPLDGLTAGLGAMLADVGRSLYDQAVERRDAQTRDVATPDEIDGTGFFRIKWDALGREDGETKLAERGFSVRCLVTADGDVPAWDADDDLVAYVAKAY